MRITLPVAAFTIAAFLPTTSHAQVGDAGEAGATSAADAGAPGEAQGGAPGGSAGKGGTGGSAGAPRVPAPNLPDPGTDTTNSCSFTGRPGSLGIFGATLTLGAAILVARRKRRP